MGAEIASKLSTRFDRIE